MSGEGTARWRRLGWLASLYLVQGIPFGFQTQALIAMLVDRRVPLRMMSLAWLLALPWSLKALWAPWVDAHWSARLGKRRSWILPMQALLVLALLGMALAAEQGELAGIAIALLFANGVAATMDIAVDGLAVDMLQEHELGYGNAIQVVGYKVGMILGGGLSLYVAGRFFVPWSTLLVALALTAAVGWGVSLMQREPGASAMSPYRSGVTEASALSAREVIRRTVAWLGSSTARWTVFVVMTYKWGEALIDGVMLPTLVRQGVAAADVGLVVGTFGMVASIAGSFAGGLIASRRTPLDALLLFGGIRTIGMLGQAVYVQSASTDLLVLGMVTSIEHLAAGALATSLFAFMMQRVDRTVGATHYTVLATLEVLGKAPLSLTAGILVELAGTNTVFGAAMVLSALWATMLYSQRARWVSTRLG